MNLPSPEPAAGVVAYDRQRERRFHVSPEARSNWDRYQAWIADGCGSLDVNLSPIKAYVSPVSQCNFRCTMCAVSDFPRGKRAEPMSAARFRELIDQMPTIVEMSPTGLSEITMMAPNQLIPMLEYVREKEIWLLFVTNGSLLHQRNWISSLVDLAPNELTVSIDGTDAATFQKIRRGSNFDRVIANVRSLSQAMDKAGIGNRLKVQATMQRANAHQLREFVPFIASLGIRSLAICIDIFDWGSNKWRNQNSEEISVFADEELLQVVEQGKSYGVRVGLVTVNQKFLSKGPPTGRCRWPFVGTMVASDSRYVPCCHISNPDYFEIDHGGGTDAQFGSVWKSEAYQSFRQRHLSGDIPDACASCYGDLDSEGSVSEKVYLTPRRGA